jgi:hypothetical protein
MRYPYRKWSDGEWHTANRWTDFVVDPYNLRVALNSWARNNDFTVETEVIDPETVKVRFTRGGPKCKHCGVQFTRLASNHQYCATCVPPDNIPARQRMSNFNLSEPEFQALRAALSDGLCPICKTWEATHVDHDHSCCGLRAKEGRTCGRCTRGLLCGGCNIMIERVEAGKVGRVPTTAQQYLAS